jgi:adenylyl-sulfate kinase
MDDAVDTQSLRYARGLMPADGLPLPYGKRLVQAFAPAPERALIAGPCPDLPRLPISAGELLDLELIAAGALSPLTGFMTAADYDSVLTRATLHDGRPWGLPVTLAVSREAALAVRTGQEVALCRGDDIVGLMQVEQMYPWDAAREARALGVSPDAARIRRRRVRQAAYLVGGPVMLFAARGAAFMQSRHRWPLELRGQFLGSGWRQVAVTHVAHPWRRTHEYLLKCAIEASDALLLHTPAGTPVTTTGIPADLLATASRVLIENYFPVERVLENPLPAALLEPSPRAVLMHAILSQNYGAGALFIPSPAGDGAARELLAEAARHGLTIQPVYVPAAFHCEPCSGIATHKSCPHTEDQRMHISDTDIVARLRNGEGLPALVTRPEVARLLARGMAGQLEPGAASPHGRHLHPHASEVSRELRQALIGHKACALWMTGLSGSGKSTVAHRLERELLLAGHRVFVLDGDGLRHSLNRDLGFSEADRRENLRRAAEVAKVMVEAGMIVIASFISPFRAERDMVRGILGPAFREVYVEANLETCEQRDPKGLYRRARAGQIPQFTGIGSPYEPPVNPDVRLDTAAASVEACVQQLHDYLAASGMLRSARGGRPATPADAPPAAGAIRIQ